MTALISSSRIQRIRSCSLRASDFSANAVCSSRASPRCRRKSNGERQKRAEDSYWSDDEPCRLAHSSSSSPKKRAKNKSRGPQYAIQDIKGVDNDDGKKHPPSVSRQDIFALQVRGAVELKVGGRC